MGTPVASPSVEDGSSANNDYPGSGDDELSPVLLASLDDRVTASANYPVNRPGQMVRKETRADIDNAVAEADKEEMDLWARMRASFQLDLEVDNPRVRQQLDWLVKHPIYIERVVARGSRYIYYVLEQAEQRGLPGELALLPVVESAYDPFAYSHGRAAGLWQFIPSTGKYYGLTSSWWHDDRRDVVSATDAALRYLERLAGRFDGDYARALASYNSGAGTVFSAMRKNKRQGKPTDYWSLDLPHETEQYVPKLIALSKVIANPHRYGIDLPELRNEPYFDIVDTGGQIDLAQAADLAGVDIEEIYLLNPSYNRWATNPDGPHRLLVPVENAEQFRTALMELDPEKRVSWRTYKVKAGDTVSGIAHKFDTTSKVVSQVNHLKGSMIRIGQQLLIPTARDGSESYVLSQKERLDRVNARRSDRGTRINYKVRSGDTLWDIARAHDVSVKQLAYWNDMSPKAALQRGKTLVIWNKNTKGKRDSMVRRVGYKVRKGDSLSVIADKFSVRVNDIVAWNSLKKSRYLQPGQSLVLYVDIRNSP